MFAPKALLLPATEGDNDAQAMLADYLKENGISDHIADESYFGAIHFLNGYRGTDTRWHYDAIRGRGSGFGTAQGRGGGRGPLGVGAGRGSAEGCGCLPNDGYGVLFGRELSIDT